MLRLKFRKKWQFKVVHVMNAGKRTIHNVDISYVRFFKILGETFASILVLHPYLKYFLEITTKVFMQCQNSIICQILYQVPPWFGESSDLPFPRGTKDVERFLSITKTSTTPCVRLSWLTRRCMPFHHASENHPCFGEKGKKHVRTGRIVSEFCAGKKSVSPIV